MKTHYDEFCSNCAKPSSKCPGRFEPSECRFEPSSSYLAFLEFAKTIVCSKCIHKGKLLRNYTTVDCKAFDDGYTVVPFDEKDCKEFKKSNKEEKK